MVRLSLARASAENGAAQGECPPEAGPAPPPGLDADHGHRGRDAQDNMDRDGVRAGNVPLHHWRPAQVPHRPFGDADQEEREEDRAAES